MSSEPSKKTPLSSAFSSPCKKPRSEATTLTPQPLRSSHKASLLSPARTQQQQHHRTQQEEERQRARAHYQRQMHKKTYFNDPVHGQIAMDGLCLRIIDTKQFQRLRDLKQLGTCDYVFPGATHSRFSHSLGVAHYAELVVRTLMKNQPELQLSEQDVLCVKVAGLCHDLGHGPYSHVFDGVFMARMRPDAKWRHEDWSISIFRHLLSANDICLADYGLSEQDQLFIEEIVRGTKESERRGRPHTHFFLYDVVNNTRSGLDVDKLDYFLRDIRHTNVCTSYDQFQRFIEYGRVFPAVPVELTHSHTQSSAQVCKPSQEEEGDEGKDEDKEKNTLWNAVQRGTDSAKREICPSLFSPPHSQQSPFLQKEQSRQVQSREKNGSSASTAHAYMICYPEKMVGEALQLFMLRYQLHQKVYTHKTVKKVELMLVDALEKADPYILIPGTRTVQRPNGKYRLSECVEDAAALSLLTDQIVFSIETSTSEELRPAREIIARIRRRDFYSCLGKTVYKRGTKADRMTTDEIANELVNISLALSQKEEMNERNEADLSMVLEDDEQEGGNNGFEDDEANIQSQDSFAPWVKSTIHDSYRRLTHQTLSNNGGREEADLFLSQASRINDTPSTTAAVPLTLNLQDIIVEKMHIHYGLKGENPVSRLRFFPKDVLENPEAMRDFVAAPMKESMYETLLPRVFEELAVRVFCRDKRKNRLLAEAYQVWCRDHNNSSTPFPTLGNAH